MFRKCPEHGWLATSEYTVADDGEPVCPICYNDEDNCGREGSALHGHKYDPPNGVLKRAQSNPREKFTSEIDHSEPDNTTTTDSANGALVDGPLFGEE